MSKPLAKSNIAVVNNTFNRSPIKNKIEISELHPLFHWIPRGQYCSSVCLAWEADRLGVLVI